MIPPVSNGLFLTFEGLDGSGKTTQLRRLAQRLEQAGRQVTCAQEPGGTRVGQQIRRILLEAASADLRPVPELLLYFASRAQNVEEVIWPALQAGRIVLADRFTDASVAYQGYGRELGEQTVLALDRIACRGLHPDLTFLIEIDMETSLRRALDREAGSGVDESRLERESREFHERVRQGYQRITEREPHRVLRIDGRRGVDDVAEEIWSRVQNLLGARPYV